MNPTNIFYFLIIISLFSFNNCGCTNENPFKLLGICVSDCEENMLFGNKTCIPISTAEDHITNMFNKIVSYYKEINIETISNEIIIEGEGINFIITTNKIQYNNNFSLINLGDYYDDSLTKIASKYYIVLINVMNSDYMTTSNGVRIFKRNGESYLLSNLYDKANIEIGVPVNISYKEKRINNKIKNKYGYDIINSDDPFYKDKCTVFTTDYNSDMSLKKRYEVYGDISKDVCSDKCTFEKFDEDSNKIYCNCIFSSSSKKKEEIESDKFNIKVIKCINKLFNNIEKNDIFFCLCIFCFSFIICFILTCIFLSKTLSKYLQDFTQLKYNILNYFPELKKKYVKEKEKTIIIQNNEKNSVNESQKENKISEKEDEENEDDEEEEEESDEIDEENANRKNNINPMNNPYYNYFLNNQNNQFNIAYNPYYQYQMYQQYMAYYMNNFYNKNNNKDYDGDEEEVDEKAKEKKRKGKTGGNKFPEVKDIDKNAYLQIQIDYDKIIEYAKKMKKLKEKAHKKYYKRKKTKKDINYELTQKNNIKIFKKKDRYYGDNNILKLFIKDEENLDKNKKHSSYKNDMKIQKRNQNHYQSHKLKGKYNLNIKNKTYKSKHPKNKSSTENILISPNIKSKNKLNKLSKQNNVKKNNNNEDKNVTGKKDIDVDDSDEESEEEDKKEYNNKKDYVYEKEKKLYGLNINSNGDNSTINNILNNSRNKNLNKVSRGKQLSATGKIIYYEIVGFKLGSEEFFKLLKKIPEDKTFEFFKESEFNHLEYEYACDIDRRSLLEIYFSLFKEQNNIIFPFTLCGNDYNLPILKFSFFNVQMVLYLTVSTLFFGDDILDNIFENKNKFKTSYMIKPMIFTFLICLVITIILKSLVKLNNNIVNIKYEIQTYQEGINAIRLKLIFYFFISFIINAFGFIFVSCFCSIFNNTQIKIIKCAGFTLASHFVLSIFFCFIITSLRVCSINSNKKKAKCLYEFGDALTYA